MPSSSKKGRFSDIVRSLFTAGNPSAEAYMEKRKKKIDTMSTKQQGGMFDIIYKKRKEREKALSEIDY